jgi:amino acid transporter
VDLILIGWAMLLDYLVIPIVNVVYPALTFKRLFPAVPYAAWAVLIVGIIIFLNLLGIRFTARANEVLLAVVSVVVVAFFYSAVRYLFHLQGWGGLISLQPLLLTLGSMA